MASGVFVSYLRVSTGAQARSGLGIEAQRQAVRDFLNGGQWELLKEFVEVESGKRDNRPELAAALAMCRLRGATLLIAKLDRLSRDAHFLLSLQKAGVRFVACDMPHADNFTVGILAMVAQKEREMIARRTRDALAAARRRGVSLGGNRGNLPAVCREGAKASALVRSAEARQRASDLSPMLKAMQAQGCSLNEMAKRLNAEGVKTARGKEWQATQVARILEKIGVSSP
ncbi:MAG: recombinase family protein [Methylobacteriaceae bacterium]|nr:recombinase family protein [Methylobacteriaceae bacterium]